MADPYETHEVCKVCWGRGWVYSGNATTCGERCSTCGGNGIATYRHYVFGAIVKD